MTIHLPKDVEAGVLTAVHDGHFASLDAAMTEAARLLLLQLKQVDADQPVRNADSQEHKPIWEEIQELTADVTVQEWDKLPADLAEQHDHYLYGTPKRPAS